MVDLGFVGAGRPANDYRFLKVTDGDTPTIKMAMRMVSIDTPESQFGGAPDTAQATLERAKARRMDGTYDALPQELRGCLVSRITADWTPGAPEAGWLSLTRRTAWHSRSKARRPRQLRFGQPVAFTRMLSLDEEASGRPRPSPSSPERG
ncbi:hypothetical protein [Streptomyces europaeiscabiei]|uniref:hypothetical protein n=1 Tax=Streptomyces europaeiscabiei TaxID=146819 RepID=UPI0038F7EDAB